MWGVGKRVKQQRGLDVGQEVKHKAKACASLGGAFPTNPWQRWAGRGGGGGQYLGGIRASEGTIIIHTGPLLLSAL